MKTTAHPFARRPQQGFTLIELMVGMGVGLLVTLAIAGVLLNAENQRRTSTTGSDAQINGGMALYSIERQLKMAGYGLVTDAPAMGCNFQAQYGGAAAAGAPPVMAPVLITPGADGGPDTLRILASAKTSFVMPTLLTETYDPSDSSSIRSQRFSVSSTLGIAKDDLLVLVYGANQACQLFQAGDVSAGVVARIDSATWNANKFPSQQATSTGAYLLNLGGLKDISYSISADLKLRAGTYSLASQSTTQEDLQSNIVTLKALYGKDSNGDDVVDTFDTVTPANNAEWQAVRAVRVAVLARSAQYQQVPVTTAVPQWDVGSAGTVAGSAACGSSRCIALMADISGDAAHYRYKVFEVLVPLRNQVWRSDFTAAPAPP